MKKAILLTLLTLLTLSIVYAADNFQVPFFADLNPFTGMLQIVSPVNDSYLYYDGIGVLSINETFMNGTFVPYIGATNNVDLGSKNITADNFIGNGSLLKDLNTTFQEVFDNNYYPGGYSVINQTWDKPFHWGLNSSIAIRLGKAGTFNICESSSGDPAKVINATCASVFNIDTNEAFQDGTVIGVFSRWWMPQFDNTYDFGHPQFRWRNGYFAGNITGNVSGKSTIELNAQLGNIEVSQNITVNNSLCIGESCISSFSSINVSDKINLSDLNSRNRALNASLELKIGLVNTNTSNILTSLGLVNTNTSDLSTRISSVNSSTLTSLGLVNANYTSLIGAIQSYYLNMSSGARNYIYASNYWLGNNTWYDTSSARLNVNGSQTFEDVFGRINILLNGSNGGSSWFNSSGNFGIGTDSPDEKLQIAETTHGADSMIHFTAETVGGTEKSGWVGYDPDTNFVFLGNGASYVSKVGIDSDGDVGVGTTTPDTLLHVEGADPVVTLESTSAYSTPPSVTINSKLKYNAAGTATNFGKIVIAKDTNVDGNTGGYMSFWNKPAGAIVEEGMRLDPDGKLGIGTINPQNELTVIGSINTTGNLYAQTNGARIQFLDTLTHGQSNALYQYSSTMVLSGRTGVHVAYSGTARFTFHSYYLYPVTSGDIELGRSTKQWENVWSVDGTFSDDVTVAGELGVGTTSPAVTLDVDSQSNTEALRLRGTAETAEIADIYVGSGGQLVISTKPGTDSGAFLDIQTEDDNYGLIIRESDGTDSTPYANLYVHSNGDNDFININVNAVGGTEGLRIFEDGDITGGATLDIVGDIEGANLNAISNVDAGGNVYVGGTLETDQIESDTTGNVVIKLG